MNKISTSALITSVLFTSQVQGFSVYSPLNGVKLSTKGTTQVFSPLYQTPPGSDDDQDNEIDRLRSMAAKLRAEAAALEVCILHLCIFFS